VHLHHGVTHDVLAACWFRGVPLDDHPGHRRGARLLAERGMHVEDGVRLHTGADVVAHLSASGQLGLLDATEVRMRRPAASRAGRHRFVSGKARVNTVKALVITDPARRLLCCGAHPAGPRS
jgi:hypothetical protein